MIPGFPVNCVQASPPCAQPFPSARYIWLTRRDKARQAISYFLAWRTEEWWRTEASLPSAESRPPR